MNGVRVRDFGGSDDSVGAQVAVGATRAPDANGFVGELHMQRLDVGFGVNGKSLDTQLATGANNSQGDFTAVCDEDLLNHKIKKPLMHNDQHEFKPSQPVLIIVD
jgi:hypothetical protein